jgi:hypothetical protein
LVRRGREGQGLDRVTVAIAAALTCGSGCGAIRTRCATPGTRSVEERIYPRHLVCHGRGMPLYGHVHNGNRRMTHPAQICATWTEGVSPRVV